MRPKIDVRRTPPSAIVAALALVYGFSSSPTAALDPHLEITNRLVEQWVDAYNRKDAAALDALYSSNAMLLPRGHPGPVVGEPAIREYFNDLMKQLPVPNYKITRSELVVVGPKAMVQCGTWSSDTLHMTGDYLAVIAEEDGEWKFIATTWNEAPEPGIVKDTSQTGTSTPDK